MGAFFKGFVCAAKGIARAVMEERNLRFHLCAAFYVIIFSFFYGLSASEYVALTLVIAGVLALEILNSAIERVVDRLCPGHDVAAGLIKDMAAGAVLAFCLGAAVCGILLFWDTAVFARIFWFFIDRPLLEVLFAASLVAAGWFVFGIGRKKGKK